MRVTRMDVWKSLWKLQLFCVTIFLLLVKNQHMLAQRKKEPNNPMKKKKNYQRGIFLHSHLEYAFSMLAYGVYCIVDV